jgi:cob(I)alamin adenosyltransferase
MPDLWQLLVINPIICNSGWTLIFLPHILPCMSIITGRGDSGETDLLFGKRIAKTSLRIEALGCVDELNAALGIARASGADPDWVALIDKLQDKLIGLMGQLATLPEDEARYRETKFPLIEMADVEWVVAEAHGYEARGIRFSGWARPGAEGCLARAGVDFARSVARRAERSILALHESGEPVPESVRLFFNKLADLLWILARVESE